MTLPMRLTEYANVFSEKERQNYETQWTMGNVECVLRNSETSVVSLAKTG